MNEDSFSQFFFRGGCKDEEEKIINERKLTRRDFFDFMIIKINSVDEIY